MAAQSEQYANKPTARIQTADARPAATIIPLRRPDDFSYAQLDDVSGPRIGPARGLVLGVMLGALLWAGIGLLTWQILH